MNKYEELKQAIINNNFFDFICNNYYEFSKEELKEMVKELYYVVYEDNNNILLTKWVKSLTDNTTLFESVITFEEYMKLCHDLDISSENYKNKPNGLKKHYKREYLKFIKD